MFITLQDPDGTYEATLGTMHDVLPEAMANFLAPIGTEWDSPIVGDALDVPAIPGRGRLRSARSRAGKADPLRGPNTEPALPIANRPMEQAWQRARDDRTPWELAIGTSKLTETAPSAATAGRSRVG